MQVEALEGRKKYGMIGIIEFIQVLLHTSLRYNPQLVLTAGFARSQVLDLAHRFIEPHAAFLGPFMSDVISYAYCDYNITLDFQSNKQNVYVHFFKLDSNNLCTGLVNNNMKISFPFSVAELLSHTLKGG